MENSKPQDICVFLEKLQVAKTRCRGRRSWIGRVWASLWEGDGSSYQRIVVLAKYASALSELIPSPIFSTPASLACLSGFGKQAFDVGAAQKPGVVAPILGRIHPLKLCTRWSYHRLPATAVLEPHCKVHRIVYCKLFGQLECGLSHDLDSEAVICARG
jgi:hypothetical protein